MRECDVSPLDAYHRQSIDLNQMSTCMLGESISVLLSIFQTHDPAFALSEAIIAQNDYCLIFRTKQVYCSSAIFLSEIYISNT